MTATKARLRFDWQEYYRQLDNHKDFVENLNTFYQLTALVGSLFLTFTVPAIYVESGEVARDIIFFILIILANVTLLLNVTISVIILATFSKFDKDGAELALKDTRFTHCFSIPTATLFIGLPASFAAFIVKTEVNFHWKWLIGGVGFSTALLVIIYFFLVSSSILHVHLEKKRKIEVNLHNESK